TLTGTPAIANKGMVSVTVHVEEPSYPSNFANQTFQFNVVDVGVVDYFQDFEGACPNGWALTGDWQCGTPTVEGPSAAWSG
ncbi:hypothetical protein ABTL43_19880, partial [Acinetobacter baumannii]